METINMTEILQNIFNNFGLTIDEDKCNKLITYYELLVEKNKVMNLTSITEVNEVFIKHFLDSCSLSLYFDLTGSLKVADMGTGAGFPGIPLKILFPLLDITLVDSLQKRLLFLDDVIERLELSEIRTAHFRAEDFSREKDHRESYDLCVSRAVARLSVLSEYCLPCVRTGGHFISYKSADIEQELEESKNSLKLLGGSLQAVEKFSLTDDIGRSFVIIEKTKNTPLKYPRKAGTPSRAPL